MRGKLLEEPALAHVDDDRHLVQAGVCRGRQLRHRRDQLRRQVVDAEVAEILERADRLRLPRAGQAGQDDEPARAARAPAAPAAVADAPAPLRRRAATRHHAALRARRPRRRRRRVVGLAQLLLEPRREIARRVQAARPQQLIAGRHLDEDREVAPGRHRHVDERHLHAEQLVDVLVEPEAVVLARRIPALELDDELHALRRPRRRDAEQIADVDHAEAAHLHVVARQLRAGADHLGLAAPPHLHRVVGDQPMAAHDQIERALALADAAVADDQHAQAEDVHQHAVDDLAHGERIVEERADLGDRQRRGDGGAQQRHAGTARRPPAARPAAPSRR